MEGAAVFQMQAYAAHAGDSYANRGVSSPTFGAGAAVYSDVLVTFEDIILNAQASRITPAKAETKSISSIWKWKLR